MFLWRSFCLRRVRQQSQLQRWEEPRGEDWHCFGSHKTIVRLLFKDKAVCLEILTWKKNEIRDLQLQQTLNPKSKMTFSSEKKSIQIANQEIACIYTNVYSTRSVSGSVAASFNMLKMLVLVCAVFDLHSFTFCATVKSAHLKIASSLLIFCWRHVQPGPVCHIVRRCEAWTFLFYSLQSWII